LLQGFIDDQICSHWVVVGEHYMFHPTQSAKFNHILADTVPPSTLENKFTGIVLSIMNHQISTSQEVPMSAVLRIKLTAGS